MSGTDVAFAAQFGSADQTDELADNILGKWTREGLPNNERKGLPSMPATEKETMRTELVTRWKERSVWELWCKGTLERYYIMLWLVDDETKKEAQIVGRYLLMTSRLVSTRGESASKLFERLNADSVTEDFLREAKAKLDEFHMLTAFSDEYDATPFMTSLEVILATLPAARHQAGDFLADPHWSSELVLMKWLCTIPVSESDFKHQRPVGVGGFGIVSIGFKSDTGKPYALKRAKIGRIDGKESDKAAAQLEWRIASTMRSPFLADASYGYINSDEIVLVLRLMGGGDLGFHLKKSKQFPASTVAYYLASAVCGLQKLHEAGIAYRDLKAANMLLDHSARAKLSDFGLAADTSDKQANGAVGTTGFWAPEQLNGNEYGVACDLWTLGVCAFHWATGKKPFEGSDKAAVKASVSKGEFDATGFDVFEACPSLLNLIQRLLVLEPTKRIGAGDAGYGELKEHAFFEDVDWTALMSAKLDGPLTPPTKVAAPPKKDVEKKMKELENKSTSKSSELYKSWAFVNSGAIAADFVELIERRPEVFTKAVRRASSSEGQAARRASSDLKRRPSFQDMGNVDLAKSLEEMKQAAESQPASAASGCCTVQ